MERLKYPALPSAVLDPQRLTKTDDSVPGPSLAGKQWGLATIGFFEVFNPLLRPIKPNVVPCSRTTVVAVIDTGIDYTHPELQENLWVNAKETGPWSPPQGNQTDCRDKSCNNIDDDGNGFVDDVIGWDFVNNVPLPYDTHGHGTHIAGIIASQPKAGDGVIGICPKVSMMILKYYDSSVLGYNNLTNTVHAIQYAIYNGANIVNYSGGGSDPAPAEKIAIANARSKGILFVAAAGNNGLNNEKNPYFPASYGLDNIISVASIDQDEHLLSSSNWGVGEKGVHIAAPGLSILSTLPRGRSGSMSGTSQATAFVTGAAALLMSQGTVRPNYLLVKDWLLNSAKPLPKQKSDSRIISGGILSLPNAVAKSIAVEQRPIAAKRR